MREWQSQSHVKWYCRYHVVIIPKYRRKVIYGCLRKEIGEILRNLSKRFGIEIIEGHAMPDHIHLCLSIPPKYSVANTVGKLKGKSALIINQKFGRQKNMIGKSFWATGYCVSTIGLDERVIRNYIKNQEVREKSEEQLRLNLK